MPKLKNISILVVIWYETSFAKIDLAHTILNYLNTDIKFIYPCVLFLNGY